MKRGRVKEYQLEKISEEIIAAVKSDLILRDYLGENVINDLSKSISKQKGDIIFYLVNKLPDDTYMEICTSYLKKHVAYPNHKDEIEYGLRTWLVELINRGYASEYIYNYLQKLLSAPHPDADKVFLTFINYFSFEQREYKIYFSFSNYLDSYKDLFEIRLKFSFEDDGNFSKLKIPKNGFIGYVTILAIDRYSAVERAYRRISLVLKYYRVLSNRKKQLIKNFVYVHSSEDNLIKLPVKSLGYRSIEIEPRIKLKGIIDSVVTQLMQKSKITFNQLQKMIDLHNEAIRQNDLNDGFLNLWSILEIASFETQGKSKIEKVVNTIIPILQRDYFITVFSDIGFALKDNLPEDLYDKLMKELGGTNEDVVATARFIFLPEYETLRDEYFDILEDYPLIRTKIYRLWSLRDNKSELFKLSSKYAERVKWHLYRLYRTRNAIVHAGDTSHKIQALGEHLHIYVDSILFELIIKISDKTTITSISDALIDTKLLLSETSSKLNSSSSVDINDIMQISRQYYIET